MNLLVFINPAYQPPQPEPEAVHALVTVETGNHSTALDTPQLQGTFSLGQFRDSERPAAAHERNEQSN